jgi:prepilin-type N-terminal cleavage/methylation domain-containing protein
MMTTRSGFTLPELMTSMVILVFGILSLVGVMTHMIRYQDLSAARVDMTTLADNKIEQLRAAAATRTVDTMQLTFGGDLVTPQANHNDNITERGRAYTRLWTVTAGVGGTKDVTLRVSPVVDDARTPRQVDVRTLILPLTSLGGVE